jgi:hypothetical protein
VSLALACGVATAAAARTYNHDAGARPPRETPGRSASAQPRTSAPRAPSAPPLVANVGDGSGGAGEVQSPSADASSSAPTSGGDPLVENGLGSPLCGRESSALSPGSRRNCATSGFEAAGAPTGNYGLDVHIDTGALGFTAATLEQDYLIGPVWMGLVWMVHTLVVALEWCFTLDLLGGATLDAAERSLSDTQAAFTAPWLVLALALASVVAAYNGLVRRRVAETLGQAALMLAMMAGGLWVIADPAGTVGALGRWVDAASIGTLGAVVDGSPAQAPRTLADSMGGLFAGVVGAPWCYLEFGDVRWCTEPALLDPRLRAEGLQIAAAAAARGGCGGGSVSAGVCQVLEGEQPAARVQSAALLRAARTNGELFLALPADQAARNSINDRASLLSVLCGGSSDATDCRGPTAQEAEYRTQGGTAARVGGLLLISLGALGMLLLLGYIALHLLGSELIGLIYLLLAPVAVIAPALGDGGRAAFRTWATRLLGAVTSKLLFSFLLGVVLLLTRTLMELDALGWWTRWLLVSATWWGAYCQRRHVLDFLAGEHRTAAASSGSGGDRARHVRASRHDSIAHRVQRQLESPVAGVRVARRVRERLAKPAPVVGPRPEGRDPTAERARPAAADQETVMLEHEYRQAREELARAPRARVQMRAKREQLERLRAAREHAAAAGDARRVATLSFRAQRAEGEIFSVQERLRAAHRAALAGERTRRPGGKLHPRAAVEERGRFLDAQAALSGSVRDGARDRTSQRKVHGSRAQGGARRDYGALASLVGYSREQYERLDPRPRREARLRIDRELAQRRPSVEPAVTAPAVAHWRIPQDARASAAVRQESTVMRDAHEVAQRRKRQLGYDG